MGKKVFVSGSIRDKKRIQANYAKIQQRGHTITHDWTRTDDLTDKLQNKAESGRRAKADLVGVMNADVFILDSNNTHVGKLMYGELCAAIVAQDLTGYPAHIYIVGAQNHPSIVYFHESVEHRKTLEDVLDEMDDL